MKWTVILLLATFAFGGLTNQASGGERLGVKEDDAPKFIRKIDQPVYVIPAQPNSVSVARRLTVGEMVCLLVGVMGVFLSVVALVEAKAARRLAEAKTGALEKANP